MQTAWLDRAVALYRGGEALPYVLGWWEFYGRRFTLDPCALIPRPDTESLVAKVLAYLRANPSSQNVVDVGTGSGCIAVTLAAEAPSCRVLAIDISRPALRIAQANARAYKVADRVHFLEADLLTAVIGGWDAIVANLPYIPSERLPGLEAARSEPRQALDGGVDGLAVLRRLVMALPAALHSGGYAVLEIDEGQGDELARCVTKVIPQADVQVEPDLAGRERFLTVVTQDPG